MSLRRRLAVAGGGAVFVALAIASLVIYFAVRSKLHDQIDFSLVQSAEAIALKSGAAYAPPAPSVPLLKGGSTTRVPARKLGQVTGPTFGSDASGYFQVIPDFARATSREPAVTQSPKSPLRHKPNGFVALVGQDAQVAKGQLPPYFRDVRYHGVAMALYTMHLPSSSDGLVRTARPLDGGQRDDFARALAAGGADARWRTRGGPARTVGRKCRAAPGPGPGRGRSRGERHA